MGNAQCGKYTWLRVRQQRLRARPDRASLEHKAGNRIGLSQRMLGTVPPREIEKLLEVLCRRRAREKARGATCAALHRANLALSVPLSQGRVARTAERKLRR